MAEGVEMSWHYRMRKRDFGDGVVWYEMAEFYPDLGVWSSEGESPLGDTPEELIKTLERMLADAKKYPVLEDTE